jgi:hypothetical protein
MKNLLGISTDAKTVKGEKYGYLTGIMYLAPSNQSGIINTCPMASKGCRMACLYTAGMGSFANVKAARIKKTVFFATEREAFMAQLCIDIERLIVKAKKAGLIPAVRLNGTSDIDWENIPVKGFENIFAVFPHVQFYDYTARPQRAIDYAMGKMPANYQLTFSKKENNDTAVSNVVSAGGNVAVVFSTENFPETYLGRMVINGDESDLRFNDDKGIIVGLKAKGKAKQDDSGFVVHA